jgi:hypothetical protein
LEILLISQTHTLFKKLFYTEAPGMFFRFTSIPLLCSSALKKSRPLQLGPWAPVGGEPAAGTGRAWAEGSLWVALA